MTLQLLINIPRGKLSGYNIGNKKQRGQSDTEQLIKIKGHLLKKHKVNAMREPYLIFKNDRLLCILEKLKTSQVDKSYQIKNPDILWMDKYGTWIIEVDGSVHDRKIQKTLERNELFLKNRIKLIVVNLSDIKYLEIDIYDYIDKKIMEIINGRS